jgi:hypothetical protein
MSVFAKKVLVNWGLALVIVLSVYLSWKMVKSMKEGFEGVYSPAEFEGYAELEEESYAELEEESYAELEEESYAELEESFADLSEIPEGSTEWGDGTPLQTSASPKESYTTLLVEPAYGSPDANAMFSPSL